MTETASDPRQILKAYIVKTFPRASDGSLTLEDGLLENGIIDSLDMIKLVSFVENEFRIFISDDDLAPENFASINAIAVFVEAKTL